MTAASDELTRLVSAIHPDLAWHFGAGRDAEHCLTVSAGGVAQVRPTAERWLRAAPPRDATWEFRCSQPADPSALDNRLDIGGESLALAETRFRVETVEEEFRVHVGVHHPAFSRLPEPVRQQITFLVLDWLLGEDDVERWLGHIEALAASPTPAASPADLRTAVEAVSALRDPDQWTLARWQDKRRGPGLATFRRGLRWIDHPTLDRHQQVVASYQAGVDGLPADAATLDLLYEVESELEALVEPRGILVGHESHRGSRTFHLYTDGEDQNVDADIARWARSRDVRVSAEPDPAWSQVRHFTG